MIPIGALEELERIATVRRRRAPSEAPLAYTTAYTNLLLAYGYSKLGDAESARQLVEEAEAALDLRDPVHAYLLAAYTAKIDQTIVGPLNLSDALVGRLGELDRVSRYKIDRLREFSRILSPIERLDPVDRWQAGLADRASPFAAVPVADRPAAIDRALDDVTPDTLDLLHDALDALIGVDQLATSKILTRTFALVHAAAATERAQLFAKTMSIADHANLPALVTESLDRMCAELRHTLYLGEVLGLVMPIASRNNLRREMAELVMATDTLELRGDMPARVLLAGCMAALGELDTAIPIFDEARTTVFSTLVLPRRLELVRAIATASAELPQELALRRILELGLLYVDITDTYGTSTHFCLSALAFIDSLVVAVVSCAQHQEMT